MKNLSMVQWAWLSVALGSITTAASASLVFMYSFALGGATAEWWRFVFAVIWMGVTVLHAVSLTQAIRVLRDERAKRRSIADAIKNSPVSGHVVGIAGEHIPAGTLVSISSDGRIRRYSRTAYDREPS